VIATTIDNNIWQYRDALGANLAISGCPSLSQSLGYAFTKLVMVENIGFAVGISTLF